MPSVVQANFAKEVRKNYFTIVSSKINGANIHMCINIEAYSKDIFLRGWPIMNFHAQLRLITT